MHFFNKISEVLKSDLPFVVYRKPNEKLVSVLVQSTNKLFYLDTFATNGFVFAPFNKDEEKILFPLTACEQFSLNITDFNELQISEEKTIVENVLDVQDSKLQHLNLVQKTIDFIQQKEADKIVVSRKERLKSSNFNLLNSYKKMLNNYPNAMVYLWFHPKVGCWLGASPERLIHCNKQHFKTMALAGTQAYVDTVEVDWKHKEKEEQQFVTDYILNTINGVVNHIKYTKPYTVKAGNLLHLRTDIYGDLQSENGLEQLIERLHPTPAICGVPKKIANHFIAENEGYNRSFYAGYLGEINLNCETNLYVNLRCMQIVNSEISIYIGGGITAESNAEKEWDETVFKTEVMKKIL
ncbi:isochorismate synthase [Lutibacter sp. HS1-25]|nr:isochorismate synthase [Lutibacter sp. HS1-25]